MASEVVLYQTWLEADRAKADHYLVCPDQRELYGCAECAALSASEYAASTAMKANPAALAYRDSDEAVAERRVWNREYIERSNGYADEA